MYAFMYIGKSIRKRGKKKKINKPVSIYAFYIYIYCEHNRPIAAQQKKVKRNKKKCYDFNDNQHGKMIAKMSKRGQDKLKHHVRLFHPSRENIKFQFYFARPHRVQLEALFVAMNERIIAKHWAATHEEEPTRLIEAHEEAGVPEGGPPCKDFYLLHALIGHRQVGHPITTDIFATIAVHLPHLHRDLGPPLNATKAVMHIDGEVPRHVAIELLHNVGAARGVPLNSRPLVTCDNLEYTEKTKSTKPVALCDVAYKMELRHFSML